MNDETKAPGIEESFEKLEGILKKLEDENTVLEESFRLYEEGLGLVRSIGQSIDTVEKKIRLAGGDNEG